MQAKPISPVRNNDLAQIHMAKAALKLDDGAYRALLSERYGVLTSAALGPQQRQDLLTEFERRGWRRGWAGKKRRGTTPSNFIPARSKDTDQLAKIRAMLAEAGRPIEYGDALAKRIVQVDRLEWATPDQLHKIIAALEYDARRRLAASVELPDLLQRFAVASPKSDKRARAMFAGAMRGGRNTPERAAAWVLTTLRNDAEKVAAEGRDPRRLRAEGGGRVDPKYLAALDLIGAIDRVRLEVSHVR